MQKPLLEKKLAEQGMLLLYSVPWPPQGIYTKKLLKGVEDMKGLKWRAYSPATARIAELVGAQPVTVQAAELSQAMATGVVESYMSSGATGYAIDPRETRVKGARFTAPDVLARLDPFDIVIA